MLKRLTEKITAEVIDVQETRQREKAQVEESELYDIDFVIRIDKRNFQILGFTFLFLIIMFLRIFATDFLEIIQYHRIPEFSMFHRVVFFILVGVGILFLLLCIILWLLPSLHVVRSQISYRNKTYHYSEISMIHVNSIKVATAYAGKKKLFRISGDYVNYATFLSWAEKCHIPIQRSGMFKR